MPNDDSVILTATFGGDNPPGGTNGGRQTNKLCPFQSIQINGIQAVGMKCIKSACQMWVKPPSEFAWSEEDAFSKVTGTNDPTGRLENEHGGRCGMQNSDHTEHIFKLVHHLHRHHQHSEAHLSCEEIPWGCGSIFLGTSLPKSFQLANEFQSNEDYDANGKIYGKDFEIELDEDTPTILATLSSNPLRNGSKNKVKWSDFIANKFPPKLRSIYPNKFHNNGGMRVRILGAFFEGDMNGFSIKLSSEYDPNLDIDENPPFFNVTLQNINVINSNKLYATIPSIGHNGTQTANMTLTNFGDTFPSYGFVNPFVNTGGRTELKRVCQYVDDLDDSEVRAKILEEEDRDTPDVEE